MDVYVIEEYQRWAKRGYLQAYACAEHPYFDCIVYANHEGLFIRCPACSWKSDIGKAEYKFIQESISMAKDLFRRE